MYLFETLSLNLVSIVECRNIPFGAGETPWRSDERVEPRKTCVEMSLIKALTWRPRRAKLIFDLDGLVRRVYLQPGLDFRGNGLWLDPHVPYREKKDGGMASLKPELGRQLWRDVGMLLASDRQVTRSTVPLANIEDVWENAPSILDVELTGLITNQSAILGWVHETLSLPKTLLNDQAKSEEFRTCVKITEDMRYILARTAERAFTTQISRQACEAFLQRIREALLNRYIPALVSGAAFCDEAFVRQAMFFDELLSALNCAFGDPTVKIRIVMTRASSGICLAKASRAASIARGKNESAHHGKRLPGLPRRSQTMAARSRTRRVRGQDIRTCMRPALEKVCANISEGMVLFYAAQTE